ncbi:PDDEXK family nuclease [Azotobacter armeniacus]
MDIHLCIVTGQPLANLIPLLQERPERVVLLVSAPMRAEAGRFARALQQAGWKIDDIERIDGLPENGYDALRLFAMEVEEGLRSRHPLARLHYNATGGNKLMALAFFDVFAHGGQRIYYTDTRHQRLEQLHPAGEREQPMHSVLDLTLCLKAEGKTLRQRLDRDEHWLEQARQRKPLSRLLGENAEELAGLIGQFNRQLADERQSIPVLQLAHAPRGLWREALLQAERLDLLQSEHGDDCRFRPSGESARRYLTGGWLEEFVWHGARDQGAEEVAIGLQFTDDSAPGADLRNEMDVAILHHNRLLLIECKSGALGNNDQRDAEIIYKLDSLATQAGGALGERLLVSAQPLHHETRAGRKVDTRARAGSHAIRTCEAAQLRELRHWLRTWLAEGSWPATAQDPIKK